MTLISVGYKESLVTHIVFYHGPVISKADAKASGQTRYFDAKPCLRGHIAQRLIGGSDCTQCRLDKKRNRTRLEVRRIRLDVIPSSYSEAVELGSVIYFTGRPCKHGHVANRSTVTSNCLECALERSKEWQRENRERLYATQAIWRAANPDKVAAMGRRNWLKNDGAAKQRDRRRRNPERDRSYIHTRRFRMQAGGTFTAAELSAVLRRQRFHCVYCNVSLKRGYHADHIMPLALGGSNTIKNIQALCRTCNQRKNKSHPVDFARKIGLLV